MSTSSSCKRKETLSVIIHNELYCREIEWINQETMPKKWYHTYTREIIRNNPKSFHLLPSAPFLAIRYNSFLNPSQPRLTLRFK